MADSPSPGTSQAGNKTGATTASDTTATATAPAVVVAVPTINDDAASAAAGTPGAAFVSSVTVAHRVDHDPTPPAAAITPTSEVKLPENIDRDEDDEDECVVAILCECVIASSCFLFVDVVLKSYYFGRRSTDSTIIVDGCRERFDDDIIVCNNLHKTYL